MPKNNIITISLTYMQKRDISDSRCGCSVFHYHINQIIKAVQLSECDSCLCIWGHILLCYSMQLNFEFENLCACVCMCVYECVCVQQLRSYPRRLDLPASRNINYFSNLQAHFPQSLPSLGREWVWPFRKPRSRPSLRFKSVWRKK